MVSQSPSVKCRRHELVSERVHLQERRHSRRIAEVIPEFSFRQGRAGCRFDSDDAKLFTRNFLLDKGECKPAEI